MRYCIKEKGLEVYSRCIMTGHVHLIIGTTDRNMQDIVRDPKRYTSKAVTISIPENRRESRKEWMLWMMQRAGERNPNNKKYQFWQRHNKSIELFNNEIMQQKADYIHQSPVVAGIVNEPEDYRYSSAMDYTGGKGLVDIKFIS